MNFNAQSSGRILARTTILSCICLYLVFVPFKNLYSVFDSIVMEELVVEDDLDESIPSRNLNLKSSPVQIGHKDLTFHLFSRANPTAHKSTTYFPPLPRVSFTNRPLVIFRI